MNKWLKIALIFMLFGSIGFAVWYFFIKKKTDANGDPILTPPPTATPPINGAALQSTTGGAGLAAINQRISQILASSVWVEIQNQVRNSINILQGINAGKTAYYDQNISRSPITSARNIPFNLSLSAKSALQNFASINVGNGKASADNLRMANKQMMDTLGTSYIGNAELDNTDDFVKQVACQGYSNCGGNYKDMYNAPGISGIQKAGDDMKKMSTAWLSGANMFESLVRERAINDLRTAGWKFTGYDPG